jgi:histidinol-phosphate aminotransferase
MLYLCRKAATARDASSRLLLQIERETAMDKQTGGKRRVPVPLNADATPEGSSFLRPRSAVTSLPPYVAGRRAVSELTAALAANESHFQPLPSVVAVVAQAGSRINRYPDSTATDLRERIAQSIGVTPEEIAVGPGSIGVLQQVITSFCDAGDEVIFAWRSFEAYPLLIALAGAIPVPVPLQGEHHDLDAIADAITDLTRLILLCTPNNPTGVSISHSGLVKFMLRVPKNILVVIDEAYVEFDYDEGSVDAFDAYQLFDNMCILRTFSKAHGLAGLRVGYAVGRPVVADALRRTALPFGVTDLAQTAAIASIVAAEELAERVRQTVQERDRVIAELRDIGWLVPNSQANFVWLRANNQGRERLLDALRDADIIARGYSDAGVRITVADSDTNDRVITVLRTLREGVRV